MKRPLSEHRPHSPIDSLNSEQRAALLRFNAYLADLEHFIVQEAEPLDRRLKARVNDPADPMIDYELEAVVSYYLRQDDPAFRDDDDNILAQRHECLTGLSRNDSEDIATLLNDGTNFNDWPGLEGESHCWLYHDLYGHRYGERPEAQALDWPDVLRIGSVWIDLQVTQQYEMTDPFGAESPSSRPTDAA